VEIEVLDRIGGGDGFAGGLFYGLLTGTPLEEALRYGWAHGALVASTPGDVSMVRMDQVKNFGSGRVVR
jgi:2-dehydro-3-deoxygluconokinase